MSENDNWIDIEDGYALALIDGKLVARNAKGKVMRSVPKKAKDGDVAQELLSLRDWLKQHEFDCQQMVQGWMLKSFPVPLSVIRSVWADPIWKDLLSNLVICPHGKNGLDQDRAGFLRDCDKRGLGIIDLDGESQWLTEDSVIIPHPILLRDLEDFRELAGDLKIQQALHQLLRETYVWEENEAEKAEVGRFRNGKFEALMHALSRCRTLGYNVRGGFACCDLFENGKRCTAQFWIGADDPDYETYTGDLMWVDAQQNPLPAVDLGPVCVSEGVRMAAAIYAGRVTEEKDAA